MRLPLAASIALLAIPATVFAGETKPKQLVIISFDGAHDNRLWDRSRKLARKTGAHFTYFLSCTYLVNPADRHAYKAPHQKAGSSATGWAQSVPEIQARLGHIWQARLEGHEMASHACGHFDGKDWTKAEWKQEFRDFDKALLYAWKNNDYAALEPAGWREFVKNDIKGFRAPYLSTGSGLVAALKAKGFSYDASLVSKGPARMEDDGGLLRFALPRIPEGPEGRLVIGMDYNLFIRHSGGLNSPARADLFAARTLAAFRDAFRRQYDGGRVPLQFGFHFVEMNGGAYWNALDTFLSETCGKPDVACVNYGQAIAMTKGRADGSAF
ncbi:MAG: polysaccharide deacetylase [Rhizobium sp.]|nr:polysaccharide deacetylase [Rhizobium sp.]